MSEIDLYGVLGVLPDAEDIVIRAAYKALAQRYHPDKWSGDPGEASRRMQEINDAFAVLGDANRRAAYDAKRPRSGQQFDGTDESRGQSEAFDSALGQTEDRWELACSVYPDLRALRARLSTISTSLAFAFVTAVLESKAFGRRLEIASKIESAFLQRYFGTNLKILNYAAQLLLNGRRDAAKFLNELVDVLGSDVDSKLVIDRVDEKFNLSGWRPRANLSEEQLRAAKGLADSVSRYGHFDQAVQLAKYCGYDVSEVGAGFFTPGEVAAVGPDGRRLLFKDFKEFVSWVRRDICARM